MHGRYVAGHDDVAVGSLRRYAEAALVATRLGGDAVPARLMGTDLILDAAGRRTVRLAGGALAGAGWLGLLLGVVAGLLAGPVPAMILVGVAFGAVAGAGIAAAWYPAAIRPGRYELRVPPRSRTARVAGCSPWTACRSP